MQELQHARGAVFTFTQGSSLDDFARMASEAAASSRLPQHVYAAMRQSDTATIATWLDGGGDVKALYGEDDETLLHLASSYGRVEIVELCIARGADCNALSGSGNTALLQAVQFLAHLDVVRVLLAAGADPLVRCEDEDGAVHTALSAAKFRKLEQNEGFGNFSAPEISARWAEIVALLSAASSNDENK